MPKLVIDARESGTSTGRYVDKLVEYLHQLKPKLEIVVLAKSPRVAYIKSTAPNFQVVASDFKEFTFGEQKGFLKQLQSLKPDLVHFTMTQQPVAYRGRVITTIHDLTTIRFDNPSKNQMVFKSKQQVYKRVIKRVAKKSKYIITPSRYVKDDVAGYAKIDSSKIIVTYESADKISETAEPIKRLAGQKFIMYVGRPQPHKNLERLVEAFARLRVQHPELLLVLAGKKDVLYERLEKLVQRQGIEGIIFTGFVGEGQLRWLYENTTAYVFPSLSEGFGLPGLEAMAHGAPVVSSNATCLPEIYGDAAHYFDPSDASDMANKINEVIKNPKLQAKLIANGKKQVTKYSWQRMAEQTLEVYYNALP